MFPNNEDIIHVQYKKDNSTSTDLFKNTGLLLILDESKQFDHIIEMSIPAPRCLLKSIYGSLQFADLVIIITGCEIEWLFHIDIFLEIFI